jgi:HK97 family phage prohead protease
MLKYMTGPITKAEMGGLDATISTPRVDADGESVDPLGLINRAEYLANPLVYWAHEWALTQGTAEPIGKATKLDVSKDRIDSAAIYAPTPKAQNVRALVLGGFVRKTSIGFDPMQMKTISGVPTHTQWALREWSIVPMPANTDATITGVKSALRWFADQIAEPEDELEPNLYTVKLDGVELIQALDKLTLGAEGGTVVVKDGPRVIARIRRRRQVVLRATWSSSYISALPDSAFACIDSAGRHYPHHNAEGSLDLPHLRAALSRIGDSSNVQCGRGHLEAHARSAGLGDR